VARDIDEALLTIPRDTEVEIAYFGGSFTGIDRELMIYLLELASSYVNDVRPDRAGVTGIRLSTRPDYINPEIMEILSRYPVKTVELGLQSMCDEVLFASKRGHSAIDAENACRLIREQGYTLIGQMMIGLPESNLERELYTAQKICDMGASGARIYPTVTFFDTELAQMALDGRYAMLTNEQAIARAKEVYKLFCRHGVECIRIGLCASDNLGDTSKVLGGANHPALGELVIGEAYYDAMCEAIERFGEGSARGREAIVTVPMGDTSKAIGQRGINRDRLIKKYGLKKLTVKESTNKNLTLTLSEQ
jgi:histone acetyltransferase (RNA polymerase elongator complex component)